MPSVSINGIQLNYRIDGRHGAPSLFLSNSLGTNMGMWDQQVEVLGSRFRIIRYDSRGHGLSDAPDFEKLGVAPITLKPQVTELIAKEAAVAVESDVEEQVGADVALYGAFNDDIAGRLYVALNDDVRGQR